MECSTYFSVNFGEREGRSVHIALQANVLTVTAVLRSRRTETVLCSCCTLHKALGSLEMPDVFF